MMKRDNVKIIMVEPYFDLKTPNSIAAANTEPKCSSCYLQ